MAKKKEIKSLDDLKLDEKNFNKHTSEGMRAAMEDNCLVIVDGKQLIEKGLIKLSEDIQEVLQLELDEDA